MNRLLNKTGTTKGSSLVEVIVALAILGIISSVATVSFVSSMQTSNKSKEQIDLNAVIDTIRENVTNAVKVPDSDILGNPGKVLVQDAGSSFILNDQSNLQITDADNNPNPHYKFDVKNDTGVGSITEKSLLKYLITLKKKDGTEVRKFRLEVNTLAFENNVP
jgi:prepilin-type N-terminal cleavage/methylation domain-containing protein